ncbi:outer membrane lipoprotein-sorting protein [Paraburkholderia dilworthii]|uniref:outer membrane lipoprotein-sorting protein n=1 Tax=Paraburkholderia dilworthii TaxID=948106 RepID=UPI0003F6E07D|nr:outer membrane lipoprotein-sorting protein [Paraburkholderia dilworthii]
MFSLALRNLWRDRRRTTATMISLVAGMLALLMFLAWTEFVENALARVVIEDGGNGHVQVYRKGGPANLSAFPERYSIDAGERRLVAGLAGGIEGVTRVSADMTAVGMIQHGTVSTVFLATGVEPATGQHSALAKGLTASSDGVDVTELVADLIGAKPGNDIQLTAVTYGNRMNAIDGTVTGFFSTGIEATEDKGVRMPLTMMQRLYDTDSVSRVIVGLADRASTTRVRAALASALERTAPGRFEVTSWRSPEVGQLYNSFMGFFDMLFLFTGTVIVLIAVATVQHTVAMNLDDRVREIATLRALGYARARIVGLFTLETLATALIAAVSAVVLTYAVAWALRETGMTTPLPRVANPVPLILTMPFAHALLLALVASALVIASSAFTCWRRLRRAMRVSVAQPGALTRALAGGALAVCCVVLFAHAPSARAESSAPNAATMTKWLLVSDLARGGIGSAGWTVRVHSQEPAGITDTTYQVAVKDGDALIRTTEPKRNAGERILIASRAMWYTKPGLRRPISVSPQQRLVGEAANGDIASTQYVRDYTPTFDGEANVDGRDCYRVTLSAKSNDATYAGVVYYLEKRTFLGVKAEFLTTSGVVFKTATFDYRNRADLDGKSTPFVSTMTITNANFPDRFSRLEYSNVQAADYPSSTFTLGNLTSM